MINIVIEGTDGSGKHTQANRLFKELGPFMSKIFGDYDLSQISYPRHKTFAGTPVDAYLDGRYGNDPKSINPYFASILYAYDRADDYILNLKDKQSKNGICIYDRYTTSNIVHQATKIDDPAEAMKLVDWIEDLEYTKLSIPKPDLVFFLNMPAEYNMKLMKDRDSSDIHESNAEYISECQSRALLLARCMGWTVIDCVMGREMLSVEDIHSKIFDIVKDLFFCEKNNEHEKVIEEMKNEIQEALSAYVPINYITDNYAEKMERLNSLSPLNCYYKNKKTGKIYKVIKSNAVNATNAQDGERMIVYVPTEECPTNYFVREINEFIRKFDIERV